MRRSIGAAAAMQLFLAFAAGAVQAQGIHCKGSITSIQGEGLVARTHRFEVTDVTGTDVAAVLEKCTKIARERQNRAARSNPAALFRKSSSVNLECVNGVETFQLQRNIQTRP